MVLSSNPQSALAGAALHAARAKAVLSAPRPWLALALASACGLAPGAHAQFKVVAADGSITYTDKPPDAIAARARAAAQAAARAAAQAAAQAGTSSGPTAASLAQDPQLPPELRRVVQRFPATLYVAPACQPCENAKQLLLQRGVPFIERRVLNEDDAVAYEALFSGRTVPTMTLGSQVLKGFSTIEWNTYLDAAGYPRVSLLPKGWQAPAATSLSERSAPTRQAPEVLQRPDSGPVPSSPAVPAQEPAPGSIRF